MAVRFPKPRFNLRTAAIVITALCLWLGIKANAARRQRLTVSSLERAGGSVWFDYHQKGGSRANDWFQVDAMADPPAPQWLRKWTGDEPFRKGFRADLSS